MKNIRTLLYLILGIVIVGACYKLVYDWHKINDLESKIKDLKVEIIAKTDSITHFRLKNGQMVTQIQSYSTKIGNLEDSQDKLESDLYKYTKDLGLKTKQVNHLSGMVSSLRDSIAGILVSIPSVTIIGKDTIYVDGKSTYKDNFIDATVIISAKTLKTSITYTYQDTLLLSWSNPLAPHKFFLFRWLGFKQLAPSLTLQGKWGNPNASITYARDIILRK